MASDFDELVDTLQYDLALAGKEGLTLLEVEAKIHAFYDNKNAALQAQPQTQSEDLLFSEEPPTTTTVVTKAFIDSAWEWLIRLKDVRTEQNEAGSQKLIASAEQLWQAVAGHSIDNTRIKGAEFPLLHIIAQYGQQGIAQPELVKVSGQDKRSVPQRTDRLAKNGYIVKIPVIVKGAKTSLLKLKKFSGEAQEPAQQDNDTGSRPVIYYEEWFHEIVKLLKEHNGVLAVDDIRAELSILRSGWQVRAFQRCMRRFTASGCIRRVKAKVAGKRAGDRGVYARAIQLVREPTDDDKNFFLSKPKDHTLRLKMKLFDERKREDEDTSEEDEDDDNMDVVEAIGLGTGRREIAPQWTRDLTLSNFVYDIVEHAGVEGISIMDLHKRGVGQVYRRPMDEELLRLCDKWQTSQPAHLKHLNIIKDTGSLDKYTFFKYRTFNSFQKAVEKGDAFWEAVMSKSTAKKGRPSHNQTTELVLDQHGFPIGPKHRLSGRRDGTAILADSARVAVSSFLHRKGDLWTLAPIGRPASITARASPSRPTLKRSATDADISSGEHTPKQPRITPPQIDTSALYQHADAHTIDTSAAARLTSTRRPHAALDTPRAVAFRATSWGARKGRRPKTLMLTVKSDRLHAQSWYTEDAQNNDRSQEAAHTLLSMSGVAKHEAHTQGISPDLVAGTEYCTTATTAHGLTSHDQRTSKPLPQPGLPIIQQDLDNFRFSHKPTRKKGGLSRAQGTVQVKRTQLILDIVRRCGGLYPGNRELYVPVAAALKRLHGTLADTSTVEKSIKDLVARGKLQKIVFQFHDSKGMQITKHILADSTMSISDQQLTEMQENIKQAHPSKYHPPEAGLESDPVMGVDAKPIENLDPALERIDGAAHSINTGADADNFPFDEHIVVQRTILGLETEENYKQELYSKHDAMGVVAKHRRPTRRLSYASSEGDEGPEEVSEDQVKLSHDFQLPRYAHSNEHAFLKRKPFARLSSCKTSEDFFTTQQPSSIANAPVERIDNIFGSAEIQTARYLDSQARAVLLMTFGEAILHDPSGTFTTSAIIAPSAERALRLQMQKSKATRKGPVTRLHGLGSSLFNHKKLFPKPPQMQVSNTARLAELESARAEALGQKRRMAEVLDDDDEDYIDLDSPVPKKKPRAYKSLRGTKSAIGVDVAERHESSTEILARDDPRLQGPSYAVTRKRDRKGPQAFRETDRLTGVVALYRVVMGGMDQRANWGIIAHMLSFKYEPDFLRRRWDLVKNGREDTVRRIMERLYEPFLQAYENNELPTIDFSLLSAVDWPAILHWFESRTAVVSTYRPVGIPQMPQSVSKFGEIFAVTEAPTFWECSKEVWFTSTVEKSRKDLAQEFVYGMPLPGHLRLTDSFIDEKLVLRSWIRAISVTKEENYNPAKAAAMLGQFPEAVVAATCEELLANKTIRHLNKGRQRPGRNYEIHDAHWAIFRRWPGKLNEWHYVRDIASARRSILDRFNASDRVFLDFHASDAEIVVFTNLVDQGLVRIVSDLPERNDDFEAPFPKISALGYSDYTYNAKTLDRERLRFPVVYERTPKYTDSHGLVEEVPIPVGPHPELDDGRVPFWVDIHGNLLPDVWDLVLRSLLQLIVFRTGCTIPFMEESHSQRLLSWEIALVMEWMEKTGIAERCGTGREVDGLWLGGWRASGWWYCAFSSEIAFWKQ